MSIRKVKSVSTIITGLLTIALSSTNVLAKEIAIYRWVDANNVVHFSQNLPKNDNYTQLNTVSSFKALSKEARLEKSMQKNAEDKRQKQQDDTATNKDTFEKNCQSAQLNIKMLSSFDEVLITEENSDGTKTDRALNDKEKKETLALNKKHIDLYCDK